MEWLRIQLQFMRERGMKAILTGHVPPARTDSKQLWDETCWQKYTLWLKQYRDVVIGGLYGHMNIDHFLLQDSHDVDIDALKGQQVATREHLDDELTIASATDYLMELRQTWAKLPKPSAAAFWDSQDSEDSELKKPKKRKSSWGERFQVTHVSPSVVPNYYPTIRIMEYNITGLDSSITWASQFSSPAASAEMKDDAISDGLQFTEGQVSVEKKKKHRGKKKPKTPDLTIPKPPSKSSPPGPAYSPQMLTFLGYTQYFANLTYINNDPLASQEEIDGDSWHEGKHKGQVPKEKKPNPKPFEFEVEYSTFNDSAFKLPDLTATSYLKLAHRIAKSSKSLSVSRVDNGDDEMLEMSEDEEVDIEEDGKHDKKKKKGKHHKKKSKNKAWLSFVKRAFVDTISDEELRNLQVGSEPELDQSVEMAFDEGL